MWYANSQALQGASNLYGLETVSNRTGCQVLVTYFKSMPTEKRPISKSSNDLMSDISIEHQILTLERLGRPLTDPHSHIPKSLDSSPKKPIRTFQCPCLVSIVEERLAIIRDSLAFSVHGDRRIVVLWRSWPFRTDINLLRVPDGHDAFVLQRSGSRPQRGNA